MSKRGTTMLDDPEQYAPAASRPAPQRSSSRVIAGPRDYGEDFADPASAPRRRPSGIKLKLRTHVPRSLAGRIATVAALLVIAGTGIALLLLTRSFLLHDRRFMIASPAAIEVQGNRHLTRAQLLDLFTEDIGRNIFRISLDERQAALEQLPWVRRATVMRLLPGRIRIAVTERTPVAFVRQGGHIGLVDATGVLLDMTAPGATAQPAPHFSFPVITGISAADPASTRAARMKIFGRFTDDLDSSGEKVSEVLSEVDLSNPEDIKALIPANSSEVLVHFGDDRFLERYRRFQEHLPAWHTQYPNLASVDMRYEREVVLDMTNSAAAKADAAAASGMPASSTAKPIATAHTPPAKPVAHKPVAAVTKTVQPLPSVHKPTASASTPETSPTTPQVQSPSASAAARSAYLAKPAAGKPLVPADQYHPPQVLPR